MGFLKDFFRDLKNPAEGIRNAMRLSYQKHCTLRISGHGPADDTSPHHLGLYGALASRYQARGTPMPEGIIWGELVPFLLMDEATSIEALAEYVVYKETPQEAKIECLTQFINESLRRKPSKDDVVRPMASYGFLNQVPWVELLEDDIVHTLQKDIEGITGDNG